MMRDAAGRRYAIKRGGGACNVERRRQVASRSICVRSVERMIVRDRPRLRDWV